MRKKMIQNEGALIVEASFVFPIMFFIIAFMIFFGNHYYLKARIESIVSQEAIKYAAYYADPLLRTIEKEDYPTESSAKVTEELYRYLKIGSYDVDKIDESIAGSQAKENLVKKINNTGFFADSITNCEVVKHQVNNSLIFQSYEVEVNYDLKFPIKFIFQDGFTYLHMSAKDKTPVTDTSEFIRNVDMAFDYMEHFEFYQTAIDGYGKMYQSINDFLNGKTDSNTENE